jgi:hypothetical protein
MPSSQELERICNVAGYPIYKWAADQLRVRSEQGSQEVRDDSNLLYLANKGAWVRVVSSVNLEPNLLKYFSTNLQIGLGTERSLAENFVLYGGTSTYAFKSQQLNVPALGIDNVELGDLQGSTTQGMNLRSGLGAYNLTGQQEINDYGYKPMPGITSVNIDTTGKMGSLRQATINFKVWDKYQLDIMDALYFRLGFTLLLEWGHAKYYDNQGNLRSSEEFMINPFQKDLTKESINIALASNTRKSYGNYGGMLGIVTSFNFTMTQDGGYDCTVKAMSLGSVMGNYAINHVSTLSNVYYEQIKQYLNTERDKAEKEAYAEAQKIQDDQIKEIEDTLKYSKDQWAKLKIDDPLSNLLFNTKNIDGIYNVDSDFIEKNINSTSQSIQYTQAVRNKIEVAPKLTPQASREKIITDVSTYKLTHDISKSKTVEFFKNESTTDPQTFINKNYYVEPSDITNYGPIIFYGKDYHKSPDQEFYIQKNSDIEVNFDVNKLNQIFSNKEVNQFSILQPPVGNLTQGTTPQYVGKNAFDTIENLRSFAAYPVAYTHGPSGLNFITDSAKQATFTIGFFYNDKTKASAIFNNPSSTYTITNIDNTGKTANGKNYLISIKLQSTKDPSFYIELGAVPFASGSPSDKFYYLSDLSLIQFNRGDQSLLTNKGLQDYNNAKLEAEKQAAETISNKVSNIINDYNAEALRATIDSESTIELMLRSLLLYGINNIFHPELLRGKPYENFIKNLFSEGAYANIFKSGIPEKSNYDKYTDEFFQKYINGSLTSAERLETNFIYGNNFYLMSGENAYTNDSTGNMVLKNQLRPNLSFSKAGGLQGSLQFVPQVDFEKLFKIIPIPYGEPADLEVNKKPNISVYINLGLFFLILNHTGIIYNKENIEKLKQGDTLTPMTYIDFNPETNFYLSSINQISIDPYKFVIPYSGTNDDYKKLFDDKVIENGFIKAIKPEIQDPETTAAAPAPTPLFDFANDKVSGALPPQKNKLGGGQSGYVGRLMDVMVDINYLLEDVINALKINSDTNEVYFQAAIEKILADLNKSMGNYNAFRLSYNDNSNCFIITDDQLQMNPDQQVANTHGNIVNNDDTFQIPLFGKESIARSFEIRSDISSRLASMIAISSNPGTSDQVSNAKNTSDFGVYNTGSFDRYIPMKTSEAGDKSSQASNIPAIELATNFNNVIKSIYTYSRSDTNQTEGNYISQDSINKAMSYYIDKMARVKNSQPESVHAMIIPLKSSITMDGMAGLYPFQLYTVDERILPYRYNSANLSNGPENLRRVAFSISKMTHTISDNQWTTSVDGFMTLLRNPSKDQNTVKQISSTTISITEGDLFGGCSTAYKEFPFVSTPPSTVLLFKDAIGYLKSKYPNDIGKSVFAILYAEASKNSQNNGFNSAGGYNYAGVQTDTARWSAPGIIGQFCRGDGKALRAFAIFKNDNTFLDFMAAMVKSKMIKGDNGFIWTQDYINKWWSPVEKAEYIKGSTVFNEKLSIYESAIKNYV